MMTNGKETMTKQPELLKSVDGLPLLPVRMLNEYVYCPRLAYLMWVQGEFADNADTVEGKIGHRRVDRPGAPLPEAKAAAAASEAPTEPPEAAAESIHARSIWLTSEQLAITGKIDLVEAFGNTATPVDYKRGKRPHIAGGVWQPERVQLCAHGLLLREHGFITDGGFIYFIGSRERVPVAFTDELIEATQTAINGARAMAAQGIIPIPSDEDYKCTRCSLIGICLPDEVRFLSQAHVEPRPIYPAVERCLPLYVQSHRARIRKDGEVLVIEEDREEVSRARLNEISQIVLNGPATLTTPALHECFRREIPVSYHSYGGWFLGHTFGVGHRNVETRIHQFRVAADEAACLKLARRLVAAKIRNGRVLIQRNWKGEPEAIREVMVGMQQDARMAMNAKSMDRLLGIEGASAARYFGNFAGMLTQANDFDFAGRNRRPPRDPVNVLLSLGYAMLVREWVVALSAIGLDPYRGFYHQPRFGRPALALDMMEPFRPLIADSVAITVLNNGEIRDGDFRRYAGGCSLIDTGRRKFIAAFERRLAQEITHPIFGYRISYRRLLEVQGRLLVRWLAGEIPVYPMFLTR
jgi:CRISPR-associated protein Cas1